jgi:hypothetical protein
MTQPGEILVLLRNMEFGMVVAVDTYIPDQILETVLIQVLAEIHASTYQLHQILLQTH